MNTKEWEKAFDELGDYHEVDGEDVYCPPTEKQVKKFIKKLLSSHTKEIKTSIKKKFDDIIGEEPYVRDGIYTGMMAITRDGVIDLKNDILQILESNE